MSKLKNAAKEERQQAEQAALQVEQLKQKLRLPRITPDAAPTVKSAA